MLPYSSFLLHYKMDGKLTILFLIFVQFLLPFSESLNISDQIQLRLYRDGNKHYEEVGIDEGHTLFTNLYGYKKDLPIFFIVHGMDMGADSYFVNDLIDAFGSRGLQNDFNIFAVDMPKLFENHLSNHFYFGVLSNVVPAGNKIGELLEKVIGQGVTAPEEIYMVGYSIGAQVAGYAARRVKLTHGKVRYLAGLDPAGPGFHSLLGHSPRLIHVSRLDATITHFLHTNSALCGTLDRVATADFVFNDGHNQPGCTRDGSLDCSHTRVPLLFMESVVKPKSFLARHCSSWNHFSKCLCSQHTTAHLTFPPDTSAKGVYYLQTHSSSPYGMGEAGASCHRVRQHKKPNSHSTFHYSSHLKKDVNIHIMEGIKNIEKLQALPELLNKSSSWQIKKELV